MHILLAAAEIRTHSLQNYEFEQTGAPATAAMKSCTISSNFSWGNLDIKTKNGWRKKAQVLRDTFLTCICWSHMCAGTPGCRTTPFLVKKILSTIFRKFAK